MFTKKESELLDQIGEYLEKHDDLDEEDGLAVFLCCQGDRASQAMIDFLRDNPDIDYSDLLLKAVEISNTVKND